MRAKRSVRWEALYVRRGRVLLRVISRPTWFLARQRAAVLLGADPCDIDVRRAT